MHKLFQLQNILENQDDYITQSHIIHKEFERLFNTRDSTWTYADYNIFAISSTSLLFYRLYENIRDISRQYVGDSRPLWINSWLNFHKEDEVLDWHYHDEKNLAHGYVSIDPKNSTTEFTNFKVENKPGVLYIGPCNKDYEHRVVVNENYEGHRITLAFNLIDHTDKNFIEMKNVGAYPLI